MNIFNPQQLAMLMYETPDRTGQTLRAIARRMGGIDAKYLSRQLNPDDPGAKIGIEDFVYFTAVTDFEPLNYIEETFGRTAFFLPRLTVGDPAPIMKLVSKIAKEFGETMQEVAESLKDGNLDKDEIKRCRKENNDLVRACIELDAYLEALDE